MKYWTVSTQYWCLNIFLIIVSTHPIIILRMLKHIIAKINIFLVVVKVGSMLSFVGAPSLLSLEAMELSILFPMIPTVY